MRLHIEIHAFALSIFNFPTCSLTGATLTPPPWTRASPSSEQRWPPRVGSRSSRLGLVTCGTLPGRPMVYQCEWPLYQGNHGITPNYTLIRCRGTATATVSSITYSIHREHCNLWRNFRDVQDNWASVSSIIDFYGDNKVQSVSACLVHDSRILPRTGSWRLRAPAAGMTPTCWSWATSDCRWSSHGPRCQACYHVSRVMLAVTCQVSRVTLHVTCPGVAVGSVRRPLHHLHGPADHQARHT